jgi:sugar lactone lactonase YvrE
MRVGNGQFTYEVVEGWGELPDGWALGDVVGIAVDSQDRVYVFNRGLHPIIVFDRRGQFLASWGEGLFGRPHGITIGPDDAIYLTDDYAHIVLKSTTDGEVLMTLGTKDCPSDTGYDGTNYRTIKRPGGPFNKPTKVALSPSGELYITDGYGNCQVHKYDSEGQYLSSWGEPGDGPGQFQIPHGICIDKRGLVYVADRENNRIQIFTPEGEFITQWTGIRRPNDLFLAPDEKLFVASMFALQSTHRGGIEAGSLPQTPVLPSYVSILSPEGKTVLRWGGEDGCAPGNFYAAHGLCLDSRGDLYVGEIVTNPGRGPAPPRCHALQKFVRSA